MNIALSAVIIFILLIPPIALYISFSYGQFPRSGPKFSLLDGILITAIISLFVHSLAIAFIKQEIRFDIFLKLLGGEIKDVEKKITNNEFGIYIRQFAIYNFCMLVLFILFGRILRFIVLRLKLNNGQNNLLRLNNRWWYFFNGIENNIENFDLVFVDAVVDTKECTMIYSGFLIDFVCDGEKLERIYIGDVVRRKLKPGENGNESETEPTTALQIPGDIFSISYEKIINLNLRFIILEDELDVIEQLPDVNNIE